MGYQQLLHDCTLKECSYVFMIKVTYAHHRKFGNHRKERNICPNSPISGKTLLNIVVHLSRPVCIHVCLLDERTLKSY